MSKLLDTTKESYKIDESFRDASDSREFFREVSKATGSNKLQDKFTDLEKFVKIGDGLELGNDLKDILNQAKLEGSLDKLSDPNSAVSRRVKSLGREAQGKLERVQKYVKAFNEAMKSEGKGFSSALRDKVKEVETALEQKAARLEAVTSANIGAVTYDAATKEFKGLPSGTFVAEATEAVGGKTIQAGEINGKKLAIDKELLERFTKTGATAEEKLEALHDIAAKFKQTAKDELREWSEKAADIFKERINQTREALGGLKPFLDEAKVEFTDATTVVNKFGKTVEQEAKATVEKTASETTHHIEAQPHGGGMGSVVSAGLGALVAEEAYQHFIKQADENGKKERGVDNVVAGAVGGTGGYIIGKFMQGAKTAVGAMEHVSQYPSVKAGLERLEGAVGRAH